MWLLTTVILEYGFSGCSKLFHMFECSHCFRVYWRNYWSLLEEELLRVSVLLPESCFLGSALKVNPEERLSITELVNQLQEIAAARNVNPKSPITEVKESHKGVLLIRSPFFPFLSNVSLVTNVRAGPIFLSLLKTSQFCNSIELIYITSMVFENVLL